MRDRAHCEAAAREIAQREQFHQFRLTEHLVPSSPQYQETLRQVAAHFVSHGASHADAQREALELLGMLFQTQATLLSFIDVFWVLAIFVAVLIPVALLLLRPVSQPGAPAIH